MDPLVEAAEWRRTLQLVNDSISVKAKRRAPSVRWHFWCECGRDDCCERVELDLPQYEALRAQGAFVLSSGH
jgi:hypothetical protein